MSSFFTTQRSSPGRISLILLMAVMFPAGIPALASMPPADQPYLIDRWQAEHGLPHNIVNGIAQTPDGYLWCGTGRGLARFDGLHFKVFNGKNEPQLQSGRIRELFVDRHGALWITTSEGGLIRFKDERFTAFVAPLREGTDRTFVRLADDESGALWLTAEYGAVLRLADGEFTVPSKEWDPTGRNFFRVCHDAQRRPWVISRSGLARLEQGRLVPVLQGRFSQYEVLCPSRSGGWWIQTEGRVRLWRDGQWVADVGERLWPDRPAEVCLEDHSGYLWVGTLGNGLLRYATNGPVRQIGVKDGLGSDLVRALYEDGEGNLWVGTRAGGLNRLRPALFRSYGRKDGLSSDLVTAICQGPEGELWVGTDGEGVNRIQNGVIQQFGKDQGLDARYISTVLTDRSGTLWAGSWPGGLYKLERDRFVPVRDFPERSTIVQSLFEDAQGRLWIGQRTANRQVRFENGAAVVIDLPNPVASAQVTAMAEDEAGSIWIATDASGLFRWKDGQCRRFTRQDGLPCLSLRSLLADSGTLWIGTLDGGLCQLKNNRFVTCTSADGLLDDVINCILDDGRGSLWFSSFNGIFSVSKAELNEFADGARRRVQCAAYGRSDGLPALECPGGFQPAGCRTRDGRLWFPTIKGLVSVDPARVSTNAVTPTPVVIEEVVVDGEPMAKGTGGLLTIRPGEHRYEFRYTGLNFSTPERVRFRLKLEGLEKDWVEVGAQRTANYSHVPPGEYRFRVSACTEPGVWNEAGAALAFTVLPYFWQTWWFIVAVVLYFASALALTVFYLVRHRLRRQLERLEMQLSVETERARIARDIHDGVGANLTEIAWLADLAEKDAVKPEEVRIKAQKISGTARDTVESFDEIVWAVLPKNDTLASLIEYFGRRVDELFENTSTRCWFNAPAKLPDIVVPAEVRHSFYLACKEALHNIKKHARATEVRVLVTVEDSTLQVKIEDNGCGFDPSANRRGGNGVRNMRKRFHDLGGRCELASQPGHGTTISVILPLKTEERED